MARWTHERSSPGPVAATEAGAWLADYVRAVARTHGVVAARRRAAHLGLFFAYLQRRGLGDLTRLPWWEYLAALGWIYRRVPRSWATAERVLDTLRDFHAMLARAGRLPDAWELERAAAIVRGGRPLRVFATLGRTGGETWRLWPTADGRLAAISLADRWLGLLWQRGERSWTAVADRLRASPVADARLATLRTLRKKLGARQWPAVERLADPPVGIAEREALSSWLGGPAAWRATAPARDDRLSRLGTEHLVDQLATAPVTTMPRAEMAELCRRGADAVGPLGALLEPGRRGPTTPLWAMVVLGAVRAPQASARLATWLGAEDPALAEAAAEALGRIGRPALPALLAATRGPHDERLHAYAALGLLRTGRAYQALLRALERDPHLLDVLARALARHGHRDAIPALHARSVRASSGVRRELEAAVFVLVHGAPPCEPCDEDWRLRYRPLPGLGGRFVPGWTGIAALAHRHLDEQPTAGAAGAPRSLDAILADVALAPALRLCRRCGGQLWRPTGLLVCRETVRPVVALQHAALARARAASGDDVWTALDDCDRREAALARRLAAGPARAAIAVERATLYWLVTRGVEDLAAGEGVFAGAAEELASLYGTFASDREVVARRGVVERLSARRPQNFS